MIVQINSGFLDWKLEFILLIGQRKSYVNNFVRLNFER
jgi:hypothetical protein